MVVFTWCESTSVSDLFRISAATPEKSTPSPYIFSAFKAARGFALWRRDIPGTSTQNTTKGFLVAGDALLDVRKVARCRSDDTYMFSSCNKLDISLPDVDWRHKFAVLGVVSLSVRKNK